MYSTSQRHKDKSKIILFISNDGKENAKEVLACKCDHIVRDMLVSWSLARIYYRLAFFWVLFPTKHDRQWHIYGCWKAETSETHLQASSVRLIRTSPCMCKEDGGPNSPTAYCILSLTSCLYTKTSSAESSKETQNIEQQYPFKSLGGRGVFNNSPFCFFFS